MTEKKQRPYKNPQINLRIPEELKIKIQEMADKNGRSMNSEIIDRLEKSLENSNLFINKAEIDKSINEFVEQTISKIQDLEKRIDNFESRKK